MSLSIASFLSSRGAVKIALAAAFFSWLGTAGLRAAESSNAPVPAAIRVKAAGFDLASPELTLDVAKPFPLSQSAVKQGAAAAALGPDAAKPYFTVRFALPIPPDNDTNLTGTLLGVDAAVRAHNHSPGFEVLPNGDVLAVYFSAKNSRGASESDDTTAFVQARLRHGAEEWDMPELFFDFEKMNEQSGLLWRDGSKVWFFGGGRGAPPWLPFKLATSTDNGATWKLWLPQLDKPAADFTPQPIANAFRSPGGSIFFAMDAADDKSFLWRSDDDGAHWRDTGGRTGARHSTIVPLGNGELLSIGGKNAAADGWSPENLSTNWGETWSSNAPSVFPPLGGNQRPCLIKLANGHLCIVTDSYHRKSGKSPEGWTQGKGVFVGISTNNGASWHIKPLPVALPHEADRNYGTLGYATVRQAPNGVIHVLATMTQPCLHYEFNEAWVFSNAGDIAPETGGGKIKKFSESYPNGQLRSKWSARICPDGRYLLDGLETDYYPNGRRQREVTYADGRKTGTETFWGADGKKLWTWEADLKNHTAIWTHFWPDGKKHIESHWNTQPVARDLNRSFPGLVADGATYQWDEAGRLIHLYRFTNGEFGGEIPLAQP